MRTFVKIIVGILVIPTLASAQSSDDALRYSLLDNGGTARFNSMAGAFGALGGDFSTLSSNPAGIGVYRSSEFSFTPALRTSSSKSSHYGTSLNDNKLNFNFNNLGAVFVFGNSGDWERVQLGIGYNKLQSFHNRFSYSGINPDNSMADQYVDQLNYLNISPDQVSNTPGLEFGSALAWRSFLVDTANGSYVLANPNYGQTQHGSKTTRGSIGETVFTFGGNYKNKLSLGATVGVNDITYISSETHTEVAADTSGSLANFTIMNNLRTEGSGYNLKLGFIYRIHRYFRIGGAYHTPTVMTLRDSWNAEIETNEHGGKQRIASPDSDGSYHYLVYTPFKAQASMAIVLGKLGIISAEYEYVDPSKSNMRGTYDNDDFHDVNAAIATNFQAVSNIKIGAEARLDHFRIRAGYANFGSPYGSHVSARYARQKFTAGVGYKEKGFYADLAYTHVVRANSHYLYGAADLAATEIDANHGQILMTCGWRF